MARKHQSLPKPHCPPRSAVFEYAQLGLLSWWRSRPGGSSVCAGRAPDRKAVLLEPLIMEQTVSLHPAVVIAAVTALGSAFGVLGAILTRMVGDPESTRGCLRARLVAELTGGPQPLGLWSLGVGVPARGDGVHQLVHQPARNNGEQRSTLQRLIRLR